MNIISSDNKKFAKILFASALPVAFQQLLQNSLSFIDTVMIGQLGETEIAAVGLTNQMFFLISVIFFGIASGASIFTSQYWGSKDLESFQKSAGVALSLGLAISLIATVISTFFPAALMKIFVKDKDVIQAGCDYLVFVGISYMFASVSTIFSVTLRSSGDMTNPMKATLTSMLSNIGLNYLLIFTFDMGIAGAAIATTVSRFIELIMLYMFIRKGKVPFCLKLCFSYDFTFMKKILKTAFPVILDDALWALGMTVYKAVYSRMGIGTLAASNVSESVQDLAFVLQNGFGAAVAVLIGNEIGKGNEKEAQNMAKRSLFWILPVSVVASVCLFISAPFVPEIFNVDPEVREITRLALISLSCTIPIKFLNHVLVTGITRSGGDTKYLLFVEMFSIWCIGVPAAYISGLVFLCPLWLVYLFVALEEISKSLILVPRTLSGKWITNLTKS